MIFEIVLMLLAGAVMAALLVHRRLESSRGISTRARAVANKADPILEDAKRGASKFVSHISLRNLVLLANFIFVQIVRFFMHASSKAHKVSSDIVTKASKKTEDLSRGGSASFYLKKIKEGKEETETK